MAESHITSGLVAKHNEIAGLIEHHKKEIARLAADLTHLDATLKLFAPEIDHRALRPKTYRQRNQYFKSRECQRMVLEIFRDAGGAALGSRQIGTALVERKGFDDTTDMIERMQKNAIGVVRHLEKIGTLVSAGHNGHGATWKLA